MAVELTRRTVSLMVAGALLTGWWGATLVQPTAPAQSGGMTGPRPLGSSGNIVQQAERLRQHVAQSPQPSRGRNPFVYAPHFPARQPSSYREAPVPEAIPAAPVAPPPPPMPIFKLSGIASNVENGAAVLTAIMNDNGSMVFAKAGDKLSRGYSVVKVDETSVTIADSAGVTQTIRLP